MVKKIIFSLLGMFIFYSGNFAQDISYPSLGKGIRIIAPDSSASMKINVRMQNLFDAGYDAFLDKTDTKFLVRRQRLKFSGFALSKDFRYKLELGFSNRDQGNSRTSDFGSAGSNIILDAVGKYYLFENFDIWFGQTKLPGNRERVISSGSLQFVDRSNVNAEFNIDRDVGVQLRYKFGLDNFIIKPMFSWSVGEGRNITANNNGGFCYTLHTDILPFGEFESKKGDYISSDFNFTDSPKLSIGLTADFNDATVRQGGQLGSFVYDEEGNLVNNDLISYFADFVLKYRGVSVSGVFANKDAVKQIPDLENKFVSGLGYNLQIGYLFKNFWEVAGRFTHVEPDNSEFSDILKQDEYTLGISKYLKQHNFKIQSDISYFNTPERESTYDLRYRLQLELQL